MFHLAEKALDQVTLLVQMFVVGTLHGTISLGRNNSFNVGFLQRVQQCVGVVPFVCQQRPGLEPSKQMLRLANI